MPGPVRRSSGILCRLDRAFFSKRRCWLERTRPAGLLPGCQREHGQRLSRGKRNFQRGAKGGIVSPEGFLSPVTAGRRLPRARGRVLQPLLGREQTREHAGLRLPRCAAAFPVLQTPRAQRLRWGWRRGHLLWPPAAASQGIPRFRNPACWESSMCDVTFPSYHCQEAPEP